MTTTPTLAHVIERAALSLAALATTGESAPGGARGARARDHRDRRDHGPGTWGKRRVPRPPGPPSDHFYMSSRDPRKRKGEWGRVRTNSRRAWGVGPSSALPRSRDRGPDGPDGPAAQSAGLSKPRPLVLGLGPSSSRWAARSRDDPPPLDPPPGTISNHGPGRGRALRRLLDRGCVAVALARFSVTVRPGSTCPLLRQADPRVRERGVGREPLNRRESRGLEGTAGRSSKRRRRPLRGVGCQSASKIGSDSFLMKLRRRCGLVSRGNQGHAVFSRLGVVAAWVLCGWSVERGRLHRHHDPRDGREQFVSIMWRGFGPGPQSISSPFGGLADRRASSRADAPRETLPLRGGSVRAAHLRRTLQRQHPQALGASHGSNSIRLSIVWRLPLEVGRRRVSHAA